MVGFNYAVISTEYQLRSDGLERTKKLEGILRGLESPIMRLESDMAKVRQQVEGMRKPLLGGSKGVVC